MRQSASGGGVRVVLVRYKPRHPELESVLVKAFERANVEVVDISHGEVVVQVSPQDEGKAKRIAQEEGARQKGRQVEDDE